MKGSSASVRVCVCVCNESDEAHATFLSRPHKDLLTQADFHANTCTLSLHTLLISLDMLNAAATFPCLLYIKHGFCVNRIPSHG